MGGLVMALGELADADVLAPGARRMVVVNRVRASAAGPSPAQSVHEALARFAGVADALIVPDDRPALDRAVLQGRTLTQVAPTSPARRAVEQLAQRLSGERPRRSRRRGIALPARVR
jgi:Flp pilus assembly CpaE family ATPase